MRKELAMTRTDLLEMLDFSRKKTLNLLENIEKAPAVPAVLGWRPGPGRAHIAWQLMHIAATDDRHVHVRMVGGEPQEPEFVRRFAGGSVPDDQIPTLEVIRQYLASQRRELLNHLDKVADSQLQQKPNPQAPWTYHEWMQVLAWHEAHHHGQAHLTFNLYRARENPELAKMGH
jgi:hypothetical protein